MTYRNSPESPVREQRPNDPRLGIEIPLDLPEHLPEPEMISSPVAPDKNNDHFLGFFYRVEIEAFNE